MKSELVGWGGRGDGKCIQNFKFGNLIGVLGIEGDDIKMNI
jgi:hypothetical protein